MNCPRCDRQLIRNHDEAECIVHGLIITPHRAWDDASGGCEADLYLVMAANGRKRNLASHQPLRDDPGRDTKDGCDDHPACLTCPFETCLKEVREMERERAKAERGAEPNRDPQKTGRKDLTDRERRMRDTEIIALYKAGVSQASLARRYAMTPSAVQYIRKREGVATR